MLIKFTQVKDVFVYNFVDIVKMAHQKLFKLYVIPLLSMKI
jgi:hypothetical protein